MRKVEKIGQMREMGGKVGYSLFSLYLLYFAYLPISPSALCLLQPLSCAAVCGIKEGTEIDGIRTTRGAIGASISG